MNALFGGIGGDTKNIGGDEGKETKKKKKKKNKEKSDEEEKEEEVVVKKDVKNDVMNLLEFDDNPTQ
jgi:hypothetical protein